MTYLKKDNDPVKTKLIAFIEELQVPHQLEGEKAHLLETLRQPGIVISDLKKRKDKSMQDVIAEVADFLDKTLAYFFEKNISLSAKPGKSNHRKR
jgi:hypothetical protein